MRVPFLVFPAVAVFIAVCPGESAEDRPRRVETVADSYVRKYPIPTPEEINAVLYKWQEQFPGKLRVEELGRSTQGIPILLAHFTNRNHPEEDKQRVLLTAMHSGENATPSHLMFLGRWLLSGDPEAEEILKRQQVMLQPLSSPDEYYLGNLNLIGRWGVGGALDADKNPEAAIAQDVIDRYLPEVHLDNHGNVNNLGAAGGATTYYRGGAGGWGRSFIHEIPVIMERAADALGIVYSFGDEGDGAITTSAPVPGANAKYYNRAGRVTWFVYSYLKSHAIADIFEVGFAEQYMAYVRALLRQGNKTGRLERYPGYRVNQIACVLSLAVSAWGDTAAKRRASRVELWDKKANVNPAVLQGETIGWVGGAVVTDPELRRRLMTDADGEFHGSPLLGDFLDSLGRESIAGQYEIEAFWNAARHVADFRSADKLRFYFHEFYTANEPTDDPLIHNGMNLRVFIPYANPTITEVLLDGRPAPVGETDGYTVYHNPGTIVEIAIPPGKTKPLHLVSVAYEPNEERLMGFTEEYWEIPETPASPATTEDSR